MSGTTGLTGLLQRQWTVVEFIKEGATEISTVPMCWVDNNKGEKMCFWPPHKKARKYIKEACTPDENWETWPINLLLNDPVSYKDALSFEKQKEKDSTETEIELEQVENKKKRRKRKRNNNSDFVTLYTDSSDENLNSIPPPPKIGSFYESFGSFGSDDTLSVTSTDLMPPPPAPLNIRPTNVHTVLENGTVEEVNNEIDAIDLQNIQFIYQDTPQGIDDSNELNINTDTNNKLQATLDTILKQTIENKKMLESIVKELTNFKGINHTHEEITNFDLIPKEPFKKFSNLLKFDQQVMNSVEAQKQLETIFFICGGASDNENIKRGLRRIFNDKLARKCSFYGRKNNYQVGNLKIIEVLKVAVRKNFDKLNDKNFEFFVSNWFRQSNLRYIRSKNRERN